MKKFWSIAGCTLGRCSGNCSRRCSTSRIHAVARRGSTSSILGVVGVGFLTAVLAMPAQAASGGSPAKGQAKAAACAGCHGVDGNGGADPVWPRLAGQDADYTAKQLADFKSGARKDPIMAGMAAPFSAQDMRDIGAYYASLKPKAGAAKAPTSPSSARSSTAAATPRPACRRA